MLIDIQTKGTAEINDQINECELGTHQCSENAACQDLKVCKLDTNFVHFLRFLGGSHFVLLTYPWAFFKNRKWQFILLLVGHFQKLGCYLDTG